MPISCKTKHNGSGLDSNDRDRNCWGWRGDRLSLVCWGWGDRLCLYSIKPSRPATRTVATGWSIASSKAVLPASLTTFNSPAFEGGVLFDGFDNFTTESHFARLGVGVVVIRVLIDEDFDLLSGLRHVLGSDDFVDCDHISCNISYSVLVT